MNITVMSWNIGGAKYLKLHSSQRDDFKKNLNESLENLLDDHKPDIVLLQEIVRTYKKPTKDLILDKIGYHYFPTVAFDTEKQGHPSKWKPYRDEGAWVEKDYLAQGLGILWKNNLRHTAVWNFDNAESNYPIQPEIVRIDTGLYTGDRDTEPRVLVVYHFIIDTKISPLDVFVVNLHFTTLKGEREGFPEKDDEGANVRLSQLNTLLHGVVSRYNEWREIELHKQKKQNDNKKLRKRLPAVWILAGDFNCLPDSQEITKLKRLNFIDLNPDKGDGTKGSGIYITKASITVDYIFAGPKRYAFDPLFVEKNIKKNLEPITDIAVSDHLPIVACLPLDLEHLSL